MAITCTNCQTQLPDDAAFCYKCGTPVASPVKEEKKAPDRSYFRELRERRSQVEDFDTYKDELYRRAGKWAEYHISLFRDKSDWSSTLFSCSMDVNYLPRRFHYFAQENSYYFPTNKPNAHEALFREAFIVELINEAVERGYLQYQSGWTFSPEALASLKQTFNKWHEKDLFFHQPDFEKIRSLAKKDGELFPEPESIRFEIAGAILNYTTWEAALVVYMDRSHKGEEITFVCQDDAITKLLQKQKRDKVQVLERQSGSSVSCAAIFMRIPLVTDEHRNKEKVLKKVDGTVKSKTFEESVTLFRERVTELDWRGRIPEVQPSPTTATSSNIATLKGATLTLKDVDRKDDECVYYFELSDPGYIDGVEEAPPLVYPLGSSTQSSGPSISVSGPAASTTSSTPKSRSRLYWKQ